MEQDKARFERSAEMFRDAKSRQMEQTNAILAGLKSNRLFSVIGSLLSVP